jgi:hypothetical protein
MYKFKYNFWNQNADIAIGDFEAVVKFAEKIEGRKFINELKSEIVQIDDLGMIVEDFDQYIPEVRDFWSRSGGNVFFKRHADFVLSYKNLYIV